MFYINTDYVSDELYDTAKLLPWNVDNYDVLNSYFLQNLNTLPVSGKFTISVEEYRPDLISYNIYGTVYYWEILMLYNNITDFTQLTSGVILNYFSARDLETLYYNLKSMESGSNS